jgi:hypothetical protein
MQIINKVPTAQELQELENGSACTMVGYLPKELHLYIEVLAQYIKGDSVTVFEYKSDDFNAARNTTLPAGLNMFSISLDEMKDINQFAVKERFQYGFRWLDDVADNNRSEVSHVA